MGLRSGLKPARKLHPQSLVSRTLSAIVSAAAMLPVSFWRCRPTRQW